jgi:hypothetical protein
MEKNYKEDNIKRPLKIFEDTPRNNQQKKLNFHDVVTTLDVIIGVLMEYDEEWSDTLSSRI